MRGGVRADQVDCTLLLWGLPGESASTGHPGLSMSLAERRAITITDENRQQMSGELLELAGAIDQLIGYTLVVIPPFADRIVHPLRRTQHNKWGYRGVEKRSGSATFRASISPGGKGSRKQYVRGSFATPKEAALAYDKAARRIYGADAVLNFPNEGEQQVMASRKHDGLCPSGHSLAEHGLWSDDGDVHCRVCKRLAVAKVKAINRLTGAPGEQSHP